MTTSEKFPLPQGIDTLQLQKVLIELASPLAVSGITSDGDSLVFETTKTAFRICYKIELGVQNQSTVSVLYYKIDLVELLRACLVVAIVSGVFLQFLSVSGLWWVFAIVGIFFFVNYFWVRAVVRRLCQLLLNGDPEQSGLGGSWKSEEGRCPACNEMLSPYQKECSQCGLRVPYLHSRQQTDATSTATINYTYNNKKEK